MNAQQKKTNLAGWSIVISLLALVIAITPLFRQQSPAKQTTVVEKQAGVLERIQATGAIHAGYGVYPPYTQEDPNTKKVSGYSVDIVEHIAKELGVKVVWHRLNWNTMSADLKRGEFDVIADPIFQTIPRAREFAFSEPYTYFADGIAVVRINDNRFNTFTSLDRKGITINVGLGRASEALVRAHFTNATIVPVSASNDDMITFQDVLAGRSDVAVADLPNAKRIVKEHPGKLKALFLDHPPAYMPAGFALRPSDSEGAEFFTVCIRNLRSTGIMSGIAKKYDLPSMDSVK
jgi:cyclohexadienyl dehydratase